MKNRIAIVDDQPEVCSLVSRILKEKGMAVQAFGRAEEFLHACQEAKDGYSLAILDLDFGEGNMDGLTALTQLKETAPDLPVVILTGKGNIKAAVAAMKAGAADFVEKDVRLEESVGICLERVRHLVDAQERNRELRRRNLALEEEAEYYRTERLRGYEVVCESQAMREVVNHAKRVASIPRPVLVAGERGTGKELVAALVHHSGTRAKHPFIPINCASLSEGLLACELFGQEANAYDGAPFKHGRFELADQGTIFLDEIGNMSDDFQKKILRVIEYQSFERVQGTKTITVDVRVVGATNTDLEQAMEEGRFRRDLYDRLAFDTIIIPPLRERKEDIVPLCAHFMRRFAQEVPWVKPKQLEQEAVPLLLDYPWPGNVREVKNVIERLMYRAEEGTIRAEHLRAELAPAAPSQTSGTLPERVEAVERQMLAEAMERCRGNQRQSAEYLGLTYDQFRHLYRKYYPKGGAGKAH